MKTCQGVMCVVGCVVVSLESGCVVVALDCVVAGEVPVVLDWALAKVIVLRKRITAKNVKSKVFMFYH